MYPSLVNCTTIDLFADWPHDALIEVGERYLSQIELAGDDKVNHFLRTDLFYLIFRNKNFPVSIGKTLVIVFFYFLHFSLCCFHFCFFAWKNSSH
jgi:hypothetical protein